jgi:RHS repeat-associated protein
MVNTMKRFFWVALSVVVLAPAVAAAQSDEVVYYHTDAIGSVRMVTNTSGAVIARYDFHPFGVEWPQSPPNASPDVRQFTAKERDAETELDYFGARYYRAQSGRFTSVDPVVNVNAALGDPQRWNRYAYAANSPLRNVDPDGRDVKYANAQLQTLFSQLSARSAMVRPTLDLYTGAGKPDLLITQGDAGKDLDGKTPAAGVFHISSDNLSVDYAGKEHLMKDTMSVQQIEDLGIWKLVGTATLTLDSSLSIDFKSRYTVNTALHELGHADQAARTPLQYFRDSQSNFFPDGRLIPHDRRSTEQFANQYLSRALKEVFR